MTLTTSSNPQPPACEDRPHVLEHLASLGDDVVASDQPPVAVDRDDPGDVEEATGAHRVGVVRDRLGEPIDADLLAAHATSFRSSLSLTRGLIRSGSTGSSRTAGFPDPSARSNAPSKSSVRSILSP